MPLPLSKKYSASQALGLYRKAQGVAAPPSLLHIHVDAREPVPDALVAELGKIGYVRDDFLARVQDYEANAPWPANHLTWKGSDARAFRDAWRAADAGLIEHGVWSYLEGEIVRLDAVLDTGLKAELDISALDRLCPRSTASSDALTFECPVLNGNDEVVGSERRQLPFRVLQRKLSVNPGHSGESRGAEPELFRSAEVHLTLRRTGMDPRLFALLKAIGLSDPIIPKLVVDGNGTPLLVDGVPLVIEDMPMTLQVVKSAPALIALFDRIVELLLRGIGGIGLPDIAGLERVSVKYEPAPAFGLYNGRNADGSLRRFFDPRTDLPPVLSSIIDRDGRELTVGRLVALGASTSSIAGHSLISDERVSGLAGFWAELRQTNRWSKHWDVRQLP